MRTVSAMPSVKVHLLRSPGGVEIQRFAKELKELFIEIGWTLAQDADSLVPPRFTGIGVAVNSQDNHPAGVDVLITGLRNMGFEVSPEISSKYQPDEVLIVVGPVK